MLWLPQNRRSGFRGIREFHGYTSGASTGDRQHDWRPVAPIIRTVVFRILPFLQMCALIRPNWCPARLLFQFVPYRDCAFVAVIRATARSSRRVKIASARKNRAISCPRTHECMVTCDAAERRLPQRCKTHYDCFAATDTTNIS
jgi:hypothetical protein